MPPLDPLTWLTGLLAGLLIRAFSLRACLAERRKINEKLDRILEMIGPK